MNALNVSVDPTYGPVQLGDVADIIASKYVARRIVATHSRFAAACVP